MTEKHFIEVEDDQEIAAVHHETDSDKWIFFCHGLGTDKEGSYEKRAKRAVEEGFNAVRFDFRGNGESDGKFIEQYLSSKMQDLEAVVDYFEPGRIFLFGMSFGGKVVLHSAKDLGAEAIVLKSPVTYNNTMDKYRDVISKKGQHNLFGNKTIDQNFLDDMDQYEFEEAVEEIDIPVAIFHGGDDTTVHFEKSARATEDLETDVMLYKLKGEKHSMSDEGGEKLLDQMFSWLKTIN